MLVAPAGEGPATNGRPPASGGTAPSGGPAAEVSEAWAPRAEHEPGAEVPVRPRWRASGKRRRRRLSAVSAAGVEPSSAELVDGPRFYRFAVDSLAKLATELDGSGADDTDLVVVVPVGGAMVVAEPDELAEAARLTGCICVAASPEPLASPILAQQMELAVAEATGSPMPRCHPYPYGLVGPAGPLRFLLADLVEWGSDADRLTTAVLSGRHDVVLDISSQFFHVLDGTGTDVVMVAGRAHAGDERPLVLIDLSPDGRGLALMKPVPVEPKGRERSFDVRPQPPAGLGLYTFTVDSLDQLSAELDAADADDNDVALVLPAHAAVVAAEPDELIEAARLSGGICVAASPVAVASPRVAQQVERAVAEATGSPVPRCHPYPCALVGPAGGLRSLLADLVDWGSDADRLTTAVLSGRHDVVLDISSQFFHVLDGTGTDAVMVAGRAHAGDEQPLVLIDPWPDGRVLAMTGRDRATDLGAPLAGGLRLYRFAVDSLAQLATELDASGADDTDLVLVVPVGGTTVVAEPDELVEAASLTGDIWVAASAVPLASPVLARQVELAVAEATGSPVLRCHPYPYGFVGPAGPLRCLLADLVESGRDADRLTAAVLSGRHEVVLDTGSQFFHVLDGTGTDVVMVAGRAHAGDERPLVLIDLNPDGHPLALITPDAVDESARDLGRLLRYDGAVAGGSEITVAAPDVLVMPLWTPEFCATVIRAAEAAALWVNLTDEPSATTGMWLHDLIPRLVALLETDIDNRIWPLLQTEWPTAIHTDVRGALILRYEAGSRVENSVGHHDLAQLSGSVRLNDGYHGGALVLPRQGWDDSAVPVGALTVWPPLVTHPYETAPVTSGVKHRLALWWRLPGA